MSGWIELQPTRHQVAIYGRVSDAATGLAIHGAVVETIQMPEAFKTGLALRSLQYGSDWASMTDRPDRKRSAVDGYFYFLDLPNGDYTLMASLPHAGNRYNPSEPVTVTVDRKPSDNIERVMVDISLVPTAVKGQITDAADMTPVMMAKIQLEASSQSTFSDRKGNYLLSNLETAKPPSNRTVNVTVSAPGYQSTSKSIDLVRGQIKNLNFSVTPLATN